MEAKIMLHNDNKLFIDTVLATSEYFSIPPIYIEKDYWITHVLRLMAQNDNANKVVFKGGTSLSKAYHLINRFSEDIDVAVIDAGAFTGNQLKTLIKKVAKEMTTDLQEVQVDGITSKGSHFYKAVYAYPNLLKQTAKTAVSSNLLVEINSFANPYPYETKTITSFITDFLEQTNNGHLITKHNLQSFTLNVLDKRRTMIEKLVSLVRFSFSENPILAISSKIRHFYDLYFLANDAQCAKYIQSADFQTDFAELYAHDQQTFDTPANWQIKTIEQSPLTIEFSTMWEKLREAYRNELSLLAFTQIPDEKKVAQTFINTVNNLIVKTQNK
jgi:Uncharacterized conserved protein